MTVEKRHVDCSLFQVKKKKKTLVTHIRLFCESCEQGGGIFDSPHLKRRDRQTKGAVCVALLAPGHGRKAECCALQTWPSCAIVSAGAPAGRWSAQSLTRPTRLQLLPTCGASQIREGVLLMGPLIFGGCKRSTCVCVWECWKGQAVWMGFVFTVLVLTLNPPTQAVPMS